MGNFGWTEILFVLVIALIIFGPRKLPELGKSLGQSLAQFRRASEDFKRTWEDEVEMEKKKLEAAPLPDTTARESAELTAQSEPSDSAPPQEPASASIVEDAPAAAQAPDSAPQETRRDWM